MVINQSYLDGFTASAGTLSRKPGLLRVALPAGEHRVDLAYRPTDLLAGLAASGLALLAWIAAQLWLWRRRSSA